MRLAPSATNTACRWWWTAPVSKCPKRGGIAAFIDAEHALDPEYARNLGVNVDELLISQPDTCEQALEITEELVRSSAVDIIVVDSVAALFQKTKLKAQWRTNKWVCKLV